MLPRYYIPNLSEIDWSKVKICKLEENIQKAEAEKAEQQTQKTINESYGTSYNSQPINLSRLRPRNISTTHYGNKL